MIDRRAPFGAAELPEDEPAADLATSLATARELEAMAAAPDTATGDDFTDRVMAAIALEPVPQPSAVAGSALRSGRPLGFVAAVRDAWRVAVSGGRPLAVRAQALALVLVAAVAVGSLLSAGGFAVAGALGLLAPSDPPAVLPSPSPPPSLVPGPSPSPSVSPPPSVSPSPSISPSPTVRPTPTATPDDTESPEATDDDGGGNSGPGGGGDDSGSGSGSGSGSSGSGSDDVASGSGSDDPPGDESAGRGSGSNG